MNFSFHQRVVFVVAMVFAPTAYAQNLVGIGGNPCNFPTISAAIAAAPNTADIYVSTGTYTEYLGTITKNLNFINANTACTGPALPAASNVYIDVTVLGSRIAEFISGSVSSFERFGFGYGNPVFGALGGLFLVDGGSTLSFTDCNLHHGVAITGGAISIQSNSTVNLYGNTSIYLNEANGGGGGVAVDEGSSLNMYDDSVIGSNTANGGGGVFVDLNSSMTMTGNSVVRLNDANIGGGVMLFCSNDCSLTMDENAKIRANTANNHGGGIAVTKARVTMTGDSRVIGNGAGTWGGGISISGGLPGQSDVSVGDTSRISFNTAENGAGIYADEPNSNLWVGGVLFHNDAVSEGGGAWIGRTTATFEEANVRHNTATFGAGIVQRGSGQTTVINTKIHSNTASDAAGGIGCQEGSVTMLANPACLAGQGNLPADEYCSKLDNNQAERGAALWIAQTCQATVEHTAIRGNTNTNTTNGEPVIKVSEEGELTISNALVVGNTADIVAATEDAGLTPVLDISHATITDNATASYSVQYTAGSGGDLMRSIVWQNGAVYVEPGRTLDVTCSNIDAVSGSSTGANVIGSDPLFVTTSRGDFRLDVSSPSVDACSSGAADDLDGVARPQGQQHDQGCFEMP